MTGRTGNKYGARRTQGVDCRWFDSGAEADRAAELRLLEQGGAIADLRFQPKVILAEAVAYKPDFAYVERGRLVYEDVKGVETERFLVIVQLWKKHGPALLRITKRRGTRATFIVTREIMPSESATTQARAC